MLCRLNDGGAETAEFCILSGFSHFDPADLCLVAVAVADADLNGISHPVAQKSFSERGLDADKAVDGILAHGADDRIGLLLVILGDIDSDSFAYAHFILG